MRLTLIVLLAVSVLGCAHVDSGTRTRRTLLGVGAAALFIGALTTGGCTDNQTGCEGGPDDANLAAGIPLMVGGTALMGTSLLVKPGGSGRQARGKQPIWQSRGY